MTNHIDPATGSMATPSHLLISSDRVNGTDVYDTAGEKLGTVESMLIDRQSGQVRFAVMSFGGFLGMGERYHQLPWKGLTYDTDKDGYVVNVSQKDLKNAPAYSRDELDNLDHDGRSASIDTYYAGIDGFYGAHQQAVRNGGAPTARAEASMKPGGQRLV